MRAIKITMFCLIFLSVALAQSEVSNNFQVTANDQQIFNKGWVYTDVTNLNTFYGRDFDLSMLLYNNSAIILAIEEKKNISHIVSNYTTTCNPWTETINSTLITHANCTTVNNPYTSWYPDWKPAKRHMIDGKSNTQKTTNIHIGKGETKQFRVYVKIPIGSKVKYDVVVSEGEIDTTLDPWIYSNWHLRRCYTAFENSGTALTNHQINITVDTATLISAEKLRSDCNDSRWGNETGGFNFYLEKGCNTAKTVYWTEIPYIPANGNATVCHYYNNSAATTSLSNGTATFKFFDDFTGTEVDTSKWIVTANCAGHYGVSGGTFNFNGSGTGSWDCSVFTQNNFSRPFIYELDAWTNNTASAWGMGIHDNTSGAGLAEFIYWLFWEGASDRFAIYEEVTKRLDTAFDYPTSAWVLSRFWVMDTGANYTVNKTTTTNETWLYNSSYSSEDNVKVGFNYQTGTTPKVDNVKVRAYAYPEPNYTAGNEESSDETITITIHSPTAITYLNNSVLLNFTVTSNLRTIINTTIQLNGTTYLRPNVTNNSAYTMTVNLSRGAQIINIIVTLITNKSLGFYTIYDNVTSTAYSTPVYETTNQTFNVSIISPFTISNVQLLWNSTQYATTAIDSTAWYANVILPLVSENNTNVTFYWNYTVGAPGPYLNTSSNYTQTIIIAHNISDALISSLTILEGDLVTFTLNFTNHFGSNISATANAVLIWNGTSYAMPYISRASDEDMYRTTIEIPQITASGNNVTITYSHGVTFTYNSISRTENISNTTTVHKLVISNATGNMSIVIKTYLENTRTQLFNVTFEVGVNTWNRNVTHNYTLKAVNVDNITLYISPTWATFLSNISVIYSTPVTTQRTITLFRENLTGQLREISLFLLNVSDSLYSELVVMDWNSIPAANIMLSVHRLNYDYNSYDLIAQSLTDTDGKITTYLIPYYVDYFFTLRYPNGTLIKQESRKVRTPLDYTYVREIFTLYQAISPMHTVWTFLIDRECEYNNVTLILTCTVTDTSDEHLTNTRLVVDLNHINRTRICDSRANGTSATHTCNLSAMTSSGASYYLYGTSQNIESILTWGTIAPTTTARYGEFGVLIAVGLILVGALFGVYYNPIIAMLFSLVGLIAANSMGYLDMSATGIAAVVVIFATIAIKAKA